MGACNSKKITLRSTRVQKFDKAEFNDNSFRLRREQNGKVVDSEDEEEQRSQEEMERKTGDMLNLDNGFYPSQGDTNRQYKFLQNDGSKTNMRSAKTAASAKTIDGPPSDFQSNTLNERNEPTAHNIIFNLNEVAQQSSFSTCNNIENSRANIDRSLAIRSSGLKQSMQSVAGNDKYKYIPNNFKSKEGAVAFQSASRLNLNGGLAGIYNMGNTCFFSTSIQCLSSVQPLTDFFMGNLHVEAMNRTNPMGSGGQVTQKFASLIKRMWSAQKEGDKIYPQELLKTLGQFAKHLVCGTQQDAQEFLAYLLDILHEDLNRADKFANIQQRQRENSQKKTPQVLEEEEECNELTEEQQELKACEAWKDHLQNDRSIIVDLFQGQLKSTLQCLKCNHISLKFDSFMYLSVPLPKYMTKQPTLEECVQEFTKEEILEGDDKWKCPKCKSFQTAKKKIDIWKLPSVLIVHLKRFEFSSMRKGNKIKDQVHFPLRNLDLTPYVSRLQRDKPIYDLFAVINHEGFLGGGHYYSYTKHRHTQQWYYFNDDVVRPVKREDQVVSSDAYILFYSKMSVDEFCRQTLSEPGLWPHMVGNDSTQVTKSSVTKKNSKQSQKQSVQQTPHNKSQIQPTILTNNEIRKSQTEFQVKIRDEELKESMQTDSQQTPLIRTLPSVFDYCSSTVANQTIDQRRRSILSDMNPIVSQYERNTVNAKAPPITNYLNSNYLSTSKSAIGGLHNTMKQTPQKQAAQMMLQSTPSLPSLNSQSFKMPPSGTSQIQPLANNKKTGDPMVINYNSNNYYINLYAKQNANNN